LGAIAVAFPVAFAFARYAHTSPDEHADEERASIAEPNASIAVDIPDVVANPVRVLIISEDGMRPDAIVPHLAPNHVALMRDGMVARRAFTVHPSETLPAHASMLSGYRPHDHKLNGDAYEEGRVADVPTIFSIARDHGLSTAMFIGKPKLQNIAGPETVTHFERPGFFCKTVAKAAADHFVAKRPDISFIHFTDPDNAGHMKGWMSPTYLRAVRESDRCLGIVLDAIDRAGLRESTLVIVTADHGGSGRSHSGRGGHLDKRIPWIARGPQIPSGLVLDTDVATVDTAATALAALQLPRQPGMVGVAWLPVPGYSDTE
jgi:arylsulfatase A-like enzyme